MKEKDKTIIILLIFTWMIVCIGVLGAESEISKMEQQVQELYNKQDQQYTDISERIIEEHNYVEEQLSAILHKNNIQDITLARHFNRLNDIDEAMDVMFEDMTHEVNSFEEAVNNLTPNQISLPTTWTGVKLNNTNGVVIGPSGRETYYNMDMSFCVNRMRSMGYSTSEYPVWTRQDGCKMFGPYIMVAANFKIRPLGTILETSLGWAIVVDTGGFIRSYPRGIDIATNWR